MSTEGESRERSVLETLFSHSLQARKMRSYLLSPTINENVSLPLPIYQIKAETSTVRIRSVSRADSGTAAFQHSTSAEMADKDASGLLKSEVLKKTSCSK